MKCYITLTDIVKEGIEKYNNAEPKTKKENFVIEENVTDDYCSYVKRTNCLANSHICNTEYKDEKDVDIHFEHNISDKAKIVINKNTDSVMIDIITDKDEIFMGIQKNKINLDKLNLSIEEHTGNKHNYEGLNYKCSCFGYNVSDEENCLERPITIIDSKKSEVIEIKALKDILR